MCVASARRSIRAAPLIVAHKEEEQHVVPSSRDHMRELQMPDNTVITGNSGLREYHTKSNPPIPALRAIAHRFAALNLHRIENDDIGRWVFARRH